MSADSRRIKDLFGAALDLPDPATRQALLDRECGDDLELRRRVEVLLAAHEAPHRALQQPLAGPPQFTGAYPFPAEVIGTIIAGRYKLLQAIGEGGMGSVFMADQIEPVKRRVALKLIRAGMDSRTVLARFEAERQALALMDHPNIAKVLDAGTTESQHPYFVMELVKGVQINQFCDEHKLNITERLNLFTQVCSAVQHAHQKGIIHRDLKPSNVLVESHDGKPVPKVIDFGLAKAMSGQPLTENTLFTALGSVAGTPLYMAPEQATFNALDVDTRADIYALGVILYELLTGTTPIERATLKQAAFDEILRVIRESEPPKPSTRLSQSGESLPSVAAQRKMEPAKLSRFMRGDLDWITMKALEKDRTRRYETANGLARDIQRYLSDEPVEACPPSAGYRLRKFAMKNRAALATASLFAFTLVLFSALSIWFAIDSLNAQHRAAVAQSLAEQERDRATQAAESEAKAKLKAQEKEKLAIEQRARAEKASDRTRQVLDAMVSGVTGDSLTTQKEVTAEQKKFLTEVLTYYQEFAGVKADDEQTRARTANAALHVGSIEYRLGRKAEGLAALQMARAAYQELAADFPAVPAYRQGLASSHDGLGALLAGLGKRADAEEHDRQALAIQAKLAADFPTVRAYRQELSRSHNNLGNLLRDLGRRSEAEEQYRLALAIQVKLAADFPTVLEYRQGLAKSHVDLGLLLADLGRRAEAEEQYRLALLIQEKLAADFPADPVYRWQLAQSHGNLGLLLAHVGKRAEAEEQYRLALAIRTKLVAEFPDQPGYRVKLGGVYCNFGILVQDGGKPAESLMWFQKAIDTLGPVLEKEPRDAVARQFLRNSYASRAQAYERLEKYADAVMDWDRAIELSEKPEQPQVRAGRATSNLRAGQVAEAAAEIAELTKTSNWNANQWYDFACVYAVASGKAADKKDDYAKRAMELLHQAVKAGYKDAVHMKKDTDLDGLREREDFKKLIAELEAKAPTETRPSAEKKP